jgi:transcriptional regulator with XRE-family HTH domain
MNDWFYMVDDATRGGLRQLLASNVRRLRIARHLSLSQLARSTGTSKATLSGIENGRANPTVETLATLAGALGASLAEVLQELPPGEVRVVRAVGGERRRLLGAVGGDLELLEIALRPREVYEAKPAATGSRAHLYVLQGKLIAGPVERVTELAAGDFVSFPADVPHVYEAGRHPAHVLLLSPEV